MRILYIDVDTLRPDHLGCYGYHRNTSPNIDSIAKEAIRFNNYYTSDAPCLPSRSALMSGRFGIHTGVINHMGIAADFRPQGQDRDFMSELGRTSLPATLKKSGLYTCYIGGFGERHSSFNFYAGFREIIDTGKGGLEDADEVNKELIRWLNTKGSDDNWFMHVNYWDPHTPYKSPDEFGNPFKDEPLIDLYNQKFIDTQRTLAGPHTIQDINMYDNSVLPEYPKHLGEIKNMDDMHAHIDGYDCEIKYMDQAIGEVIAKCKELGVWDDMVVIISSDHGENFGELGLYAEHATADYATCRIPLIIRWPGITQSSVNNGLWYNVDLLPSLAELIGAEPHSIWDGKSFASVIRKADSSDGREELILSQNAHVCQRSVRFGKWLYIRTYHDGWHLFDKEMLFDVESDPYEQNNIAKEHPDICYEASWRLLNWHDEMMMSAPKGYASDPMWEVIAEGGPGHARGQLPMYLERLKSSGREDKAEQLAQKYPNELKLENPNL